MLISLSQRFVCFFFSCINWLSFLDFKLLWLRICRETSWWLDLRWSRWLDSILIILQLQFLELWRDFLFNGICILRLRLSLWLLGFGWLHFGLFEWLRIFAAFWLRISNYRLELTRDDNLCTRLWISLKFELLWRWLRIFSLNFVNKILGDLTDVSLLWGWCRCLSFCVFLICVFLVGFKVFAAKILLFIDL